MSASPAPPADALPGPAAEARATRWLRRLCLFIVITACAEFLIATTGVQIGILPPSTDFATFYIAGLQARDGLSPYDRAAIAARGHSLGFAHDQFPYLYPPPFALAMQAIAHLSYPRARQVWMLLANLELFAALAVTVALVRRVARTLGLADPRRVWIVLAAFFPAALNATSVHNDVRAGSVGCLLYLSFVVVAWALVPEPGLESQPSWRRDAAIAVALTVATLAKLTPVVFVAWLAWRGARRAALLTLALLAVTMLPAFAHWGLGIVPDYVWNVIVPSVRDEVAPPMNQSLDGFLSRLFIPGPWVTPLFVAPRLKWVLSVLGSLAIAVATLRALARRLPPPALRPVELGCTLLALLALMKLTWVQTLTAMLFVWPVLIVVILRAAEGEAAWARRAGFWACAGFFLSSAHVPILYAGLRHGPAVLVTGVHLLGVLILWGVSLAVLRRQAEFATQGWAPTTARDPALAGIRL